MVDARFKAKIIAALRRLSYTWPARKTAKAKRKVDKALHSCELCDILCYEGKSQKQFIIYQKIYGKDKVLFERGHMDHIEPVIDPEKGWESWDKLINERLYPPLEGWQHLCPICHQKKSNKENEKRRETKKMLKTLILCLFVFLGCVKKEIPPKVKTLVLTDTNFILFRDDFNKDSEAYFVNKFNYLTSLGTKNPIYIIFDSNGGFEDVFYKITELANNVPNPVYTITINAVSAGYFSVQFIKGKQFITPDGKMMSHRWHMASGFQYKTAPNWIRYYRERMKEERPFYQQVADRLGMPLFVYLGKIDKDYYISKELALKENHVDEEIILKCSDSVPEYEPYIMTTQISQYEVYRSACPLLNKIDQIKLLYGIPSILDGQIIGARLMER